MIVTDDDYPEHPYPGAWPERSYRHRDGVVHPVGVLPASGVPVLAYGSNRCPSKITWLRRTLGLTGDVVVLAADTLGLSAVWAAGLRERDGARPATLCARPGVRERHALWWASAEQLAVLDVCEGRGVRYRLARLHTGVVRTAELGVVAPLVYVAAGPERRPLLVDGVPVRCADVDQAAARALVGVAAADDGLDVTEL